MGKLLKVNLVVIVGVIVFGLFAVGSTESTSTSTEKKSINSAVSTNSIKSKDTKQKEGNKPNFELLEDKIVKGEYSKSIVGKIKNNTDSQKGYVQVQFNLYDKEGNQVGTALANVNNLESGGTWKFEAIILEENAVSYKLSDITGF